MTDRPFADEPTEVLRHALDLANAHARQAARFRPAKDGDPLPAVAELLRAELQQREGLAAPTDQDFLVAIEEALEKNLLRVGVAVLERTRDDVLAAMGPLVDQLRAAALPAPDNRAAVLLWAADQIDAGWFTTAATATAELRRLAGEAQQDEAGARCTCGDTACESELCDCDSAPCPVDHAREARQDPTQDGTAAPLRAELKPWQLLADQPDEALPQAERVIGGRRLARPGQPETD